MWCLGDVDWGELRQTRTQNLVAVVLTGQAVVRGNALRDRARSARLRRCRPTQGLVSAMALSIEARSNAASSAQRACGPSSIKIEGGAFGVNHPEETRTRRGWVCGFHTKQRRREQGRRAVLFSSLGGEKKMWSKSARATPRGGKTLLHTPEVVVYLPSAIPPTRPFLVLSPLQTPALASRHRLP